MEIVAASPKRRTDTDEEAEDRMKRCAAFHPLLLERSCLGPPARPHLFEYCVHSTSEDS